MKRSQITFFMHIASVALSLCVLADTAWAAKDLAKALRRAQYLLNGTMPTDDEITNFSASDDAYRSAVDQFLANNNFYDTMIRYHERVYGVGLKSDYVNELELDSIDGHSNKIATIACERTTGAAARYRCGWASDTGRQNTGGCAANEEMPAKAFWYPGVVAWVCPSVYTTCGSDLSRCFINYADANAAKSSELGATEIFDSTIAITKSLSRQPAGIAAAVVVAGYPYTKVLEPGLTAIDGAVAHLFRQEHHFDLSKMSIPARLMSIVNNVKLNHTRFQLVYTGTSYEQGGVLSSFGWLRRYEKNRSRANQLYQRMLCRKFTSALPRVFPQDPGNLRETPGCNGCHATLDPLADFFKVWGEGGNLYTGGVQAVDTSFSGKSGSTVADLANIIRGDNAFGTCAVEQAWEYLMGREFYHDEAEVRAVLTRYFVATNYNFKELLYAITTHSAFTEGTRSDGVVGDPLEDPPLGQPPGGIQARPCTTTISYATDIQPKLGACTKCHFTGNTGSRQPLDSLAQWNSWGSQAVSMMTSGNMPPGQAGPPLIGDVYDLKELVRCWLQKENP